MGKYSPEYYYISSRKNKMRLKDIEQAIKNNYVLESKVIKCNTNNDLILDIGDGIRGIIDFKDTEYHIDDSEIKVASVISKINKHVKYVPLENLGEDDNGITWFKCSRAIVQKECYERYISKLKVGDIIDAYALKVVNFGIFCDIGCGIVALLPTNSISVTHIINPVKDLRNVNRLKVIVKNIDENYKIELTHKELLGTWEEEANKFQCGDAVQGVVISNKEYGTFVRLSQNLSALAEKSDVEVEPGDVVSVRISVIQPATMKIRLHIISKYENFEEDPTLKFEYSELAEHEHIDKWVYSTGEATKKRVIETVFE